MKKNALRLTILLTLLPLGTLVSQFNPDPDIFDAVVNGAGNGNSNDDLNTIPNNESLGGTVSVVDLSQLPAIGQVSGINIPTGQSGINIPLGQSGNQGLSVGNSGGMSGLPPIFSGGGGNSSGEEGQQSPFPMPQGQSGSEGGESGEIPQGNFPPPPPNIPVGDSGEMVGAQSEGNEAAGESKSQDANNAKKSSSAPGEQGQNSGENDDQEMPGNMGGSGSGSRGSGTEQGAQMPAGL